MTTDNQSLDRDPSQEKTASADLHVPISAEQGRSIQRLLFFILLIMLGYVFYFARDLIMPLILGLLFALTLRPLVRSMGKFGIPAPAAAILVVMVIGSFVSMSVYSLSTPMSEVINSIPDTGKTIKQKLKHLRKPMADMKEASGQLADIASGGASEDTQRVIMEQPAVLTSAATSLATSVTSIVIALFMALLVLSTGNLFYAKLIASMPALSGKKRALRIVYDVEHQVSTYLLTISLINAGLGLTIGFALYLVGMPNPVLWGLIAMLLNFLPFLGAIIGTIAIAAVSVVTFDSLAQAAIAPGIYYLCSLFEGNVVTPLIVGKRLKLNVVAVFLTVTTWGWLWGIAGALMAVPILVVLKVMCDHVDGLSVLGSFLSGRDEEVLIELEADNNIDNN